jgi:GrpB-like predicted nucleotidyltransferase (UPF0157 family)
MAGGERRVDIAEALEKTLLSRRAQRNATPTDAVVIAPRDPAWPRQLADEARTVREAPGSMKRAFATRDP